MHGSESRTDYLKFEVLSRSSYILKGVTFMRKWDYEIKYRFESVHVDDEINKSRGFAIWDLCEEIKNIDPSIKEFVHITSFRVNKDSRNRGLGHDWLKTFCDAYDDKIIFVLSGAHADEYESEPSEDEYKSILNRLDRFYTRVGFINVNQDIGQYQYKESFIYRNNTSEKLLDSLLERRKNYGSNTKA